MVFIAFYDHFSFDLAAEQIARLKKIWTDFRDQYHISPAQSLSQFIQNLLPLSMWNLIVLRHDVQYWAPCLSLAYQVQSPTSSICLWVNHLKIVLCIITKCSSMKLMDSMKLWKGKQHQKRHSQFSMWSKGRTKPSPSPNTASQPASVILRFTDVRETLLSLRVVTFLPISHGFRAS